ncbi:MAG: hypothetical protein M0018_05770 [Nitrospiraceae bacterium]|nr:hypothetical protein [Nitrospiraceae bacterium]
MSGESGSLDIKGYLAIIHEKRYVALAAGAAVLSIFVMASFLWPKSYKASSTVFVQRGAFIQSLTKNSGSIDDELGVIKNSITSRMIVDSVLRKLNLDLTQGNAGRYEALINNVRKHLDVKVKEDRGDNVDMFTLSYEDPDPRRARDVVNTLVNEYIEQSVALQRNNAINAYEFLNSQLQSYKEKLDDSDRQIEEFRKQHPGVSMQASAVPAAGLAALQSDAINDEVKLRNLQNQEKNLEMEISGRKSITSAGLSGGPDSSEARLDRLNEELMVLKTRYTDSYPDVIVKKAEIAKLKKQMQQEKDGQALKNGPVYQRVKDELEQVRSKIGDMKMSLDEISRQEKQMNMSAVGMPQELEEWDNIQRNRDGLQKTYNDILQKLEAARVEKNLQMGGNSSVLNVVDPAVLPVIPDKPNRVKLMALGLVMSLIAGISAAIGLDYIKKPYRSENQVEQELRLPVLISVPRMTSEEDRRASRKKDLRVFGFAGAYVIIVMVLLAREILFRFMGIRISIF